jgi:large repetitive protein
MAAPSPRKPRRTKGRHRKPSTLPSSYGVHWLGVGAVGMGLAAAIASGQGVASATTDDSSKPGDAGPSATDTTRDRPASDKPEADTPSTDKDDTDKADDSSEDDSPAAGPERPTLREDQPKPTRSDRFGPKRHTADAIDEDADSDEVDEAATQPEPHIENPTDAAEPTTKDRHRDRSESDTAPAEETTQEAPEGTETRSAPVDFNNAINDVLTGIGLGVPGNGIPLPTFPMGGLAESLLLAARTGEFDREEALAEFNRAAGWIPALGTVLNAISLVRNLGELGTAVLRGDGLDIGDEIGDITRDFIGMAPVIGAPVSAGLYDLTMPTSDVVAVSTLAAAAPMAAAEPGTEEHFWDTVENVLAQLIGWPEAPDTVFVTPANYLLDQALDAHSLTMDLLVANPTPFTQWIPDLLGIVGLFIKSALPDYTFSDGINTFGNLINRLIPPFKMVDGNGITEAQVAGAAAGALVKVLDRMLNNDLAIEHLRDAAIEGGTAGALNPSSVLGMTFTTGAEPTPFSLVTYMALVAVYERFQQVALNHLPVVTGMTQNGQILLSITGKVNVTDADGDALTYSVTQAANGVVTLLADGGWLYTRTSNWSQSGTDTFTMTIDDSLGQVADLGLGHPYSPDGHSVTVTITVNYSGTANNAPTSGVLVGLPDGMGIVRGTVSGTDIDGDTLTYSLVNPGTTGATNNSIYTSEGGVVALNTSTGEFVYIPKVSTDLIPGLDTDSFQVQVSDGRGGTSTATVIALSNLKPGTTTTGTSAYVENGRIVVPSADTGLLTYSLGAGPSKGTVVVNADGTYTYTRNSSLPTNVSTDDSFTIIGTDANGKSVTLPTVTVSPPLVNITPTTTTSGGTFTPRGMIGGTPITPGTQTTTGTFSGTDVLGNPVTVAAGIYNSAQGGNVTVLAGGGFLYTNTTYSDIFHRAAADNATAADKVDTVKINVTDSFGGTSEVTFSVQLRTENAAPSSSSSVGGADALGVVRGSVAGSDSDGDLFTYSLAGAGNPGGATTGSTYAANGGIVALNADGSFTYIPTKSASTTDSFKVLVSDGHGGTTTATVAVPLSIPSPVANVNTSTPGVVTGRLNIPAADSGLMTYSLGTGAAKGTVTVNADGTFTYTRTAGLGHSTSPADSFAITGTDIATGKTVTIATITVTPTVGNTVPVRSGVAVINSSLDDTDLSFNRQQTTTGTLGATDADGDTVSFAPGTYTTLNDGTVTVNADGTFTYKSPKKLKLTEDRFWHNAAATGAPGDLFTVAVNDGFGGVVSLVYSIPIEKLNTNPSSTVSVSVGSPDALGVVRGTLSGTDPDNNNVNYSLYGIEDTLSYGLAGAGNPAGATATSSATANGGIVQVSGNSFTYVPTQGVSADSFKVLVSDGHGGTAVATVNLTSLTTPSPVTNINTSTTNVVTGQLNIPAGDTGLGLTYSVGNQGAKGTVVVNANGTFTYTRTSSGHSTTPPDSFTIKATDALGRQVTIATVNVIPTVVNNAPTVVLNSQPTVGSRSGTTQTTAGKITWNDADGDALTINGQTAPIGSGTITLATRNGGTVVLKGDGTFTYTRTVSNVQSHQAAKIGAADNERYDYIDVTVADGYGPGTALAVQVAVYASNSAPTISGGSKSLGNVVFINVNETDGDDLSFSHNGSSFTFGGRNLGTSTLWGGSSLTVTDGYYAVVNGVVQSTAASTTKTW